MITKIDFKESHFIGFKISGHVEKEEMKTIFEAILKELDLPERFSIYMEVEDFEGFNLIDFNEGLQFSFKHLTGFNKHVKKLVFVTDKSLLRNQVTIEHFRIPRIKLKAYSYKDKNIALDWLNI